MKVYPKITAIAVLTSFVGIQFLSGPCAFAQDYKLIPPSNNQNIVDPDFSSLPVLNGSQPYNNSVLRGQVSTVPQGTAFEVITNTTIGSSINEVGDTFTATLTKPVMVDGNIVMPEGSEVIGQVTYIDNAGKAGKNGVVDIKFTSIKLPYGGKIPMSGKIITVDRSGALRGGSIKKQIVTTVATGTVITGGATLAGLSLGGLMGAAGGGDVLGTAAGGLFGLGYIVARKGKEAVLPSDTKLNIVLDQPLTVGK